MNKQKIGLFYEIAIMEYKKESIKNNRVLLNAKRWQEKNERIRRIKI